MKRNQPRIRAVLMTAWTVFFALSGAARINAQDAPAAPAESAPAPAPPENPAPPVPPAPPAVTADDASLTAEVGEEGGRIVVEAKGLRPAVPVFYSAAAEESVTITAGEVAYEIGLRLKVVQGKAKVMSVGIGGQGDLQSVTGDGLQAWSVRWVGDERFLDLEVDPAEDRKEWQVVVRGRIAKLALPATADLLHLRAGQAVGFTSTVTVTIPSDLSARLVAADGFLPLESEEENVRRYEGALGKRLALELTRSSAGSPPVELVSVSLEGTVDEKSSSASFLLRGTAEVTKDDAVMDLLRGRAAASELPGGAGYRLELAAGNDQEPLYRLRFPQAGSFPVEIRIVARLEQNAEWTGFSFEVLAGAIVPVVLKGVAPESEFRKDAAIIPSSDGDAWRGFLPLHGRAEMAWKSIRKTGEGKLFFTTSARMNVGVGAGLLRQTSIIDYKILQGKLNSLAVTLLGEGEVLEVDGANVLGWNVVEADGARRLEVSLSQPIESDGGLRIRSQLALGAFPVRAKPLRLVPVGSIRHSGFIRVYNIGATRLEVAGATGLTQLAPDQFPEQNLPGGDRQAFVYRFPAADHEYEIAADRVQPEVTASQIVDYELSESNRVMRADLELDIREAPLREWNLFIPADYLVVSVSGAEVADYVVGTQIENDERTLKVLFGKEVSGRQLVQLHLEKNQPAQAGPWILPRLRNPEAKVERGEIGVASVPGFRIGVTATEKLTEIPISRFQHNRADLQQTFRIRERDWTATLTIESLPQSVEADVFHLYSLEDQTAYASVVVNYFITGAPVSIFRLSLPATVDSNSVEVECKDKSTPRLEESDGSKVLVVPLHQSVIGAFTLLVTYEEPVGSEGGVIQPGRVTPQDVRGERGFIQVVSPVQVDAQVTNVSQGLLSLDPLELPAEFRLLSAAPPLATYQYTSRPFELEMSVGWFETGDTIPQVIEMVEAQSQVTRDGQVVTDLTLIVKTRSRSVLRTKLPEDCNLWEVTVDGQAVSARRDQEQHLIPLPSGADANALVEVKLQIGKPRTDRKFPVLTLPAMNAPIMKATWKIRGEQGRVLVPLKNQLPLTKQVLTETGLEWIAKHAIGATGILFLFLAIGLWIRCMQGSNLWLNLGGIALLIVALIMSLFLMKDAGGKHRANLEQLEFNLPVIAPGQQPTLVVGNYSEFGSQLSWLGIAGIVAGLGLIGWSIVSRERRHFYRFGGGVLLAGGLLMQGGGAVVFYLVAAIVIGLLLLPWILRWWGHLQRDLAQASAERKKEAEARLAETVEPKETEKVQNKRKRKKGDSDDPLAGPSAATLLVFGFVLSLGGLNPAEAKDEQQAAPVPAIPAGMRAADSVVQNWTLAEGRLTASGTLQVTGKPGDTILLLKSPAVLTSFVGERLRAGEQQVPGLGSCYVVSIRSAAGADPAGEAGADATGSFTATFAYEVQVGANADRFVVPTGSASVQEVIVQYDQPGWEFDSTAAMRVTEVAGLPDGQSGAHLILAPLREAEIVRRPKARDVKMEKTQFFVEVANLFLPSPGVIDGRHLLGVRPSQGEVRELSLTIPEGFTVSEVGSGPVGEWQFDADERILRIVVEPAQARPFSLLVETQSSLAPLPTDAVLAPVAVADAAGEVGLVALAFGTEAQPEKTEADGLSAVNLTDFDQGLIPERGGVKPVLHQVYRYGQGGGSLALRVAPVAPELRVFSKQILAIEDERLVLGVNFAVDITRAGLFQLSFRLPDGLEVESLSGSALSHWSELTEGADRYVILHLNGQTIGSHEFALTLVGPAPAPTAEDSEGWLVPRFEMREAQRQLGELAIKPTTGVRLEKKLLRNVSDIDPREMGGQAQGALAFRILQSDWELRLGIRKDQARITGDVLHEVTLREGQTRTLLIGNFKVERASIRSLQVHLPGLNENEAKTLRASGTSVNDVVRVPDQADLWEIQFKNRIVGKLRVKLEWERTESVGTGDGERHEWSETLTPAGFPEAKQTYYIAVRAGARLELGMGDLPKGWQRVDWNTVPEALRESGDRTIPAMAIRTAALGEIVLTMQRHSVAKALNLRVNAGRFTTVVSPVGEILTSVELDLEVIQRSTLKVTLPRRGQLYNVFVNRQSVNVVLEGDSYQFYVLPSDDDLTATVSFVYSSPGQRLSKLHLLSPELNVPLANIDWKVVVPKDFSLVKQGGDLEPGGSTVESGPDDIVSYRRWAKLQRDEEKRLADADMEQFTELLKVGEQTKARIMLNRLANNHALEADANEDARVLLNNIQTRQAVVGLNSRRQRLYLDNQEDDPSFQRNTQLEQAANRNPILNRDDVRYLEKDYGEFLAGNSAEENAVLTQIASQFVAHQRSTEPAPQAIKVMLPEDGRVFTFTRSVQVRKDAPLELNLKFESPDFRSTSREAFVLILVFGICLALVFGWRRKVGE